MAKYSDIVINLEDMVREFHRKFKQYPHLGSQPPFTPAEAQKHGIPRDVVILRMRLVVEEVGELLQAMHENDVVEIADALADLVYVAAGTAVCYGIPLTRVLSEVHRSNMTKGGLNSHGKQGKGEGFEPPQLREILGIPEAEPSNT